MLRFCRSTYEVEMWSGSGSPCFTSVRVPVRFRDGPLRAHRLGHVLVLRIAEAPNLIALEPLAWEVDHRLGHVVAARVASVHEKLGDGVLAHAREAGDGANGHPLDHHAKDLGAPLKAQPIHVGTVAPLA